MKNKSLIAVIFLFVFLCLGIMAFCFLRFRGSEIILIPNGTENIIPCENTVFFRQDDERWAEDKLGSSDFSMKKSGCLVTCIATANTMEGRDVFPGSLNDAFSSGNVYDAEGNLQWGNLAQLDGGETYEVEVFNSVSEDILRYCLNQGKFPIVRVRMRGVGNFHYVLVVKLEEGNYYCMDPLKDELQALSDYGNRVYAIRCVSLKNNS